MKDVYIIEAKRTPIGSFLGNLSEFFGHTTWGDCDKRDITRTEAGIRCHRFGLGHRDRKL